MPVVKESLGSNTDSKPIGTSGIAEGESARVDGNTRGLHESDPHEESVNNDLVVEAITRLPKQRRSSWLDNLIKVQLNRCSNVSDIDNMFENVRRLQTRIGIRKEENVEYPWFLDDTRPFVGRIQNTNEEVLPGSYSLSAKHMKFKLDVYHGISRKFQPNLDEHGHPDASGYGHDVSRLLSLTGALPNAIGVRPLDNRDSRLKKGLSNKMDPSLLTIVDDFLMLMYGIIKPARVRLESKSQSGLPLRVYGRGYKTLGFLHAVNHLDHLIDLVDKRKFRDIQDKFDINFTYLMGSRKQPDAAGKKRYITTEADALKGLSANTPVDNSVQVEGVSRALTSKFAAMRFRMVWGGNAISNAIVNVIGTSARDIYGKIFDFTLKHHGGEDIARKLVSFGVRNNLLKNPSRGVRQDEISVVAIDVTQFDGDYPAELLLKYADLFKGTPIYSLFLHQMLGVSVQLIRDKEGPDEPYLTGDPYDFNPLDYINAGMPSGWSWVSDVGKIMVPSIYFCLVQAGLLQPHTPTQLYKFMKGELEYAVLNLGDDNVILGPPNVHEQVLDALNKFCPWLCEIEQGTRFIGHIISVGSDGYFQVTHDPASYVTNILTPERGIRSAFRKYWAVGYQERKKVYLDAPVSVEFNRVLDEAWYNNYGTPLPQVVEEKAREQRLTLASSNDDDDRVLNALLAAQVGAPDPLFANRVISRYLADSSVLSWEFSREDLLDKMGVDLYDLESRPDVSYSVRVLEKSGYSDVPSVYHDDSTENHYFMHTRLKRLLRDPEWFSIVESLFNSDSNIDRVKATIYMESV